MRGHEMSTRVGSGIVLLLLVGTAPLAAFHERGVAHCNGCHTVHNSQGGLVMADGGVAGQGVSNYLLLAATPSDTCLRCHAGDGGAHHVLATDPLVPTLERGAGDFVFLLEDNLNDGHAGATNPVLGHEGGHNVIAPGHGLAADPVLSTAPGGSFPAGDLACTSCHDPHGSDTFRMLYGVHRRVKTSGGSFLFVRDAPNAIGIDLFTGGAESNANHTAYLDGPGGGMGGWCANCHGDFHNNVGALIHPSGVALGNDIADNYNRYVGTTDCVAHPGGAVGASSYPCGSGTRATAYLAQVPFEDPTMTVGSTSGPSSNGRVTCITCHRAHATSAPDAGRWDFDVTLLADDGRESGSYAVPNPYDANQRSLCNKCHSQDEFDDLPAGP